MLLLTLTTDKLQLVTDAAATVDVHASFMDYVTGATTATPGRQNTAITTATTTDIVAAPGASTQRNVKTLHIRNKHATNPVPVTLLFDQNATDFELHKVILAAGDALEYIEGVGFFTLAAPASSNVLALTTDATTNSTTTGAKITGLDKTTGTGRFMFQHFIRYQAGATTTGVKFGINHTGTVTAFAATMRIGAQSGAPTAADQSLTAPVAMSHASTRAFSTTAPDLGPTISVDTADADMLMVIEGLLIVTVNGNLELWHASEVAAASTVKDGSSLILTKTG